MRLREVDFGYVMNSSGARGFFGEGYWFHKWFEPFGLYYDGATFVAKTATLAPRKGNMPLLRSDGITPAEFFPKCIYVDFWRGLTLNAVGLSGPGAHALFADGSWQKMDKPFVVSFAALGASRKERDWELKAFVDLFRENLPGFKSPVALEMNFSCPNVDFAPIDIMAEIWSSLSYAETLRTPLIVKLNAEFSVGFAREVISHPACDAITMGNTIPWGVLPEKINWRELFGLDASPLAHLGGGGLGGKPLFQITLEWVSAARKIGIKKPIIACGGILSPGNALAIFDVGASAVQLGSMNILRPTRIGRTIRAANHHMRFR